LSNIRPFKGIRYSLDLVKDLGAVICPPYDVISSNMQHALYHKSPYNMVRLEHGMDEEEDSPPWGKYARAAATFQEWLGKGIMQRDTSPALYLHHHYFLYEGKGETRRGIIAAVRLEEWESGRVRPHEDTASIFKQDRLNLLRRCHANFSPILALYEDPENKVSSILAAMEDDLPPSRVATVDDEGHALWALTDSAAVQDLTSALEDRPLYIADGHHRYETALAYRNERLASDAQASSDAAFNFVMMTLTEFSDPGLLVLPYHRVVRKVAEQAVETLKNSLKEFFEVETLPFHGPLSTTALEAMLRFPGEGIAMGILGLEPERIVAIRSPHWSTVERFMPPERSEAYRRLDVSILHHVIMEKLLGIDEEDLAYTKSELEAWQRVVSGEYRLAFLLNPMSAYSIKAVADAGDKMPRKSTYFYPKAPAGLVVNLLDGVQQPQLL
jgi:uncharacterized protein (DUF1015 family)